MMTDDDEMTADDMIAELEGNPEQLTEAEAAFLQEISDEDELTPAQVHQLKTIYDRVLDADE